MDLEKLARFADLACLRARQSLPWSTSATSILGVLWVLAVFPLWIGMMYGARS
jgi:hypothetical protein